MQREAKPGVDYEEFYTKVEDGCEVFAHCMNCPLPFCIEDATIEYQLRRVQAIKIEKLRSEGLTYRQITIATGVGKTSIKNYLLIARTESLAVYRGNQFLEDKLDEC